MKGTDALQPKKVPAKGTKAPSAAKVRKVKTGFKTGQKKKK